MHLNAFYWIISQPAVLKWTNFLCQFELILILPPLCLNFALPVLGNLKPFPSFDTSPYAYLFLPSRGYSSGPKVKPSLRQKRSETEESICVVRLKYTSEDVPGNWCSMQVLHGNFSMKNTSLIISNLARARLVQMQMPGKLGDKQG